MRSPHGAERSRHCWVRSIPSVILSTLTRSFPTVALALNQQILPFPSDSSTTDGPQTEQERLQARARALTEVPVTEDDVSMDWIVTPEGIRQRQGKGIELP